MIENCPMRHENGNCIPAGGFCTANKNICEALLNAYRMGKAQLSQEGTTSDLISRQAARHALCKAVHKGEDIPCENQTASCLWTGTRVCDFVREIDALPPAQLEPKEGHWIKHETPDGGEQHECSRCGVLWEFNDGTPEDNEAYFCPKCGAKMKGERQK